MSAPSCCVDFHFFDEAAETLGVEFVAIESFCSLVHEVERGKLVRLRSEPLLLHLLSVHFYALHLVAELLPVVTQDLLSLLFLFRVTLVEDGVQDFLSTLLTVVDSEAHLHLFVRLQLSVRQLLEEAKDYVVILVFVLLDDGVRHHLCLRLFATLDQLEELLELNVHIIINRSHHFFDLLPGVDQAQGNQWVFQFVNADGKGAVLVQVFEAIVEDGHLVFVKVDVFRFAVLAEPLANDALRLVLKAVGVSWAEMEIV